MDNLYEEIIWYLIDLLEEEHMGMGAEAILLIKREFGIEL